MILVSFGLMFCCCGDPCAFVYLLKYIYCIFAEYCYGCIWRTCAFWVRSGVGSCYTMVSLSTYSRGRNCPTYAHCVSNTRTEVESDVCVLQRHSKARCCRTCIRSLNRRCKPFMRGFLRAHTWPSHPGRPQSCVHHFHNMGTTCSTCHSRTGGSNP